MRSAASTAPLFLSALLGAGAAASPDAMESARRVFSSYVELAHAYDPRFADLYDDGARIRSTRVHPDGRREVAELTGREYKPLLRRGMPTLRMRGVKSLYTEVRYRMEGAAVRVRGMRYSVIREHRSPFSLLVAPGSDDRWRIVEEITEDVP